eukprot:s1385_g10.t1
MSLNPSLGTWNLRIRLASPWTWMAFLAQYIQFYCAVFAGKKQKGWRAFQKPSIQWLPRRQDASQWWWQLMGHDQSHELRDLRWTQLLALKPQLLVVDGDELPVEVDLPRHRFNDVLDMGAPLTQEPSCHMFALMTSCFTGGTTGRQRCVPVTQRMALHELRHYGVALHWPGGLQR